MVYATTSVGAAGAAVGAVLVPVLLLKSMLIYFNILTVGMELPAAKNGLLAIE